MAVATFDTLKFANTLKESGVPPQQAEAQARAFADVIQVNLKDLATKDDLAGLAKATKDDLAATAKDLRHEIAASEQRTNSRIDLLETRIKGELLPLKWMLGVLLTANVGILVRLFVYRGGF